MARNPKQPNDTIVLKHQYKLCPACGNFAPDTEKQKFCLICGEKLISECEGCREPILYPTARFCPACGGPLVKKQESRDPGPANS